MRAIWTKETEFKLFKIESIPFEGGKCDIALATNSKFPMDTSDNGEHAVVEDPEINIVNTRKLLKRSEDWTYVVLNESKVWTKEIENVHLWIIKKKIKDVSIYSSYSNESFRIACLSFLTFSFYFAHNTSLLHNATIRVKSNSFEIWLQTSNSLKA